MAMSVLEQELTRKIHAFRAELATHDRAVIVGFFLSLFPIPPVSLLGLIISLFNYGLYKNGKLELSERKMILSGIALGVITLLIGCLFFYFVTTRVGSLDWESARQTFVDLFNNIRRNAPFRWMSKENVLI
jgi:hypothetical protein